MAIPKISKFHCLLTIKETKKLKSINMVDFCVPIHNCYALKTSEKTNGKGKQTWYSKPKWLKTNQPTKFQNQPCHGMGRKNKSKERAVILRLIINVWIDGDWSLMKKLRILQMWQLKKQEKQVKHFENMNNLNSKI